MNAPDTADTVSQYGTMVYRLAYAQTRSHHDADDIFQEVFLRYHRAAPRFTSEDHRKAWLIRVTVNCASSFFSALRRQRTVPLEDVYSYTDPAESAVDAALTQLSPKYRTVVHLYYYEGYQTGEIARLLNRKPSTVRAQLSRARELLGKILKEEL